MSDVEQAIIEGRPYGAAWGLQRFIHDTIWMARYPLPNRSIESLNFFLTEYSIRIEKEVIHELLLRSQVADLCVSSSHATTPVNLQLTIPPEFLTNNSRAASRFWLKLARERAVIWEDVKFKIQRDFVAAKFPADKNYDVSPLFNRYLIDHNGREVMEHYMSFYDHTGWDGKPKSAIPLPPLPPWPHLTKTESPDDNDEGESD